MEHDTLTLRHPLSDTVGQTRTTNPETQERS